MASAAVGLAACGGDDVEVADAGRAPSRAPSTTVVSEPVPAGAPETAERTTVAVYFTRGERLRKVNRSVPRTPRLGAAAVQALLAGPTGAERAAGLGTAIPPATRFRDLRIEAGVATVDLSRDFESGGGSLGLTLRLAQVTCTVDEFATVKGVRFALDGQPVSVFSGDGIVLDRPVTCAGYRAYLGDSPTPRAPSATTGRPPATSPTTTPPPAGGPNPRCVRGPVTDTEGYQEGRYDAEHGLPYGADHLPPPDAADQDDDDATVGAQVRYRESYATGWCDGGGDID